MDEAGVSHGAKQREAAPQSVEDSNDDSNAQRGSSTAHDSQKLGFWGYFFLGMEKTRISGLSEAQSKQSHKRTSVQAWQSLTSNTICILIVRRWRRVKIWRYVRNGKIWESLHTYTI